MQDPLFTVIITTYNRRNLLPRAIQSVLDQTFSDFELLMIDNGSTDSTADVVQGIKDPRLIYIRNPQPTKSCEVPRNLGIKLAKGSLISFLDDDDIWYPEKLERMKRIFEEYSGISLACHNQNMVFYGKLNGILKCGVGVGNIYETLLYERSCIFPSATTIRTELLRDFNGFSVRREFYAAGDYDLWLRMAKANIKMHFMDEILGECSISGDNGSINNPRFQARLTSLIKEHILNYEKKPIFLISKRGMWRLFQLNYISAWYFLKAAKFSGTLKHCCKAMFFIIIRPTLLFELCSQLKRSYNKI